MMTTTTFNLAIELGLHRSTRSWAPKTPKTSLLEIEIRKRIFWSLLIIHILISGKLGRPMALQAEDFDVELPEALDDDLLSEHGLDETKQGRCRFLVGIEGFKCQQIFMDLYNHIYVVKRSPKTYVETISRLEKRMSSWEHQVPQELKPDYASKDDQGLVPAEYVCTWPLEFRLLLHHPSLSLTDSVEINKNNLDICMDVSQKLLYHVKQIQKYKSLDTNWQTGALYLLAISTTLYGHWQRKESLTSANFVNLREEMGSWLSIMGDMGDILGRTSPILSLGFKDLLVNDIF